MSKFLSYATVLMPNLKSSVAITEIFSESCALRNPNQIKFVLHTYTNDIKDLGRAILVKILCIPIIPVLG